MKKHIDRKKYNPTEIEIQWSKYIKAYSKFFYYLENNNYKDIAYDIDKHIIKVVTVFHKYIDTCNGKRKI